MIGNFNLPIAKGNAKIDIFTTPNQTISLGAGYFNPMNIWNKPKGVNFVYALIIGQGQGGGGGYSFGAGTAGGGGGGSVGLNRGGAGGKGGNGLVIITCG